MKLKGGRVAQKTLNFITVTNFTTSTDLESSTDIRLPEVHVNVDVFDIHGDEEQIEPSAATHIRIAQDANDDIPSQDHEPSE